MIPYCGECGGAHSDSISHAEYQADLQDYRQREAMKRRERIVDKIKCKRRQVEKLEREIAELTKEII